ncbi:MAG TPA: helix-turn-helix domain-containing protein [Caldimonas sp.]|nr:helix-turn-helix domain-containing protein [Caldimonas sp.]
MSTATAPVSIRCSGCNVRAQCLPAGLDGEALARVDEQLVGARRKVAVGVRLFRNGDPFHALYAVRTGFFKTQVCTPQGREHVVGFRMAGDLLGLDGIAGGRHHVDAIALEDSHVCVLPFDALQRLEREVPALQERMHQLLSGDIVDKKAALVQLGSMCSTQRLAAFLLDLGERLKARGYSDSTFVLRMRRCELGSYLGLELETVCRAVAKLQAAGLMKVTQRVVRILDREGLARIRDGAATCEPARRPIAAAEARCG